VARDPNPQQQTTEIVDSELASPGRLALAVVADTGAFVCRLPESGELAIGRAQECEIFVDDPKLSRRHALVRVRPPAEVEIVDLASSNGTRVRGERLAPNVPAKLRVGDAAALGTTMLLLRETVASETIASPRAFDFVGLAELRPLLERIAASDINVLITGETGAGKEVVARTIHGLSPRAKEPLVCVNCAALSAALLESELFGHERGAFTGALHAKTGLLEAAGRGTVFLDEIGEMPFDLQAKLLRVLEQREVVRVGAVQARPIFARFLAATNRDLEEKGAEKTFRRDLFFRLNGISVAVPPLRARRGEIEVLARHFVREACARAPRAAPSIADEVVTKLSLYDWPGNVRELRNSLERALVLCDRELKVEHLPEKIRLVGGALPAPVSDVSDERARIIAALDECAGNQTQAARLLGMPRRTFVTRLDEYGIKRPRKRGA
jgi:transcriptional regulator of acetoin/glycerol metabolism